MSVKLFGLAVFAVIAVNFVFGAPTSTSSDGEQECMSTRLDNKKYPLTDPIVLPDGSLKYRLGIISDLDAASLSSGEVSTFKSYYKQGYLTYNAANKNVTVEWDALDDKKFKSSFAMNGRGLELSELITYNGKLVTLDDKTGLVYFIDGNALIPWVMLIEGDGRQNKGQKNEWATIKDSKLYVGTHGKEMKDKNGVSVAQMWVKVINKDGRIAHLNWTENFIKLRAAVGIHYPGYMVHEACVWSDVYNRWFFLPRKASAEQYNKDTFDYMGTNLLLSATANFDDIKVVRIGNIVPSHGYASFKFIPNTNDTIIAAISTLEVEDKTATFITVFTVDGSILYPETRVSDLKFEGIEFI